MKEARKYIIGDRLMRNEYLVCKVIEVYFEYDKPVYRCEINEAGVITSKTVTEKYLDTWEKIIPPPVYTPKEVAFPESVLKALKVLHENYNIQEFMKEVGLSFELEDYIIEQCEQYRTLWRECDQHSSVAKERTLYGKYMVYKELSDRIRNRKKS